MLTSQHWYVVRWRQFMREARPVTLACVVVGVAQSRKTPLIVAATYGHVDALKKLIELGADVTLTDAVRCEWLLGGDMCASNCAARACVGGCETFQRGKTALDMAKASKHTEAVKLLAVSARAPHRPVLAMSLTGGCVSHRMCYAGNTRYGGRGCGICFREAQPVQNAGRGRHGGTHGGASVDRAL